MKKKRLFGHVRGEIHSILRSVRSLRTRHDVITIVVIPSARSDETKRQRHGKRETRGDYIGYRTESLGYRLVHNEQKRLMIANERRPVRAPTRPNGRGKAKRTCYSDQNRRSYYRSILFRRVSACGPKAFNGLSDFLIFDPTLPHVTLA